LSKEIRIPFGKPNFPPIEKSLIIVGSENEGELRPDRLRRSELSLDDGAG
jgi:hypothetical protein